MRKWSKVRIRKGETEGKGNDNEEGKNKGKEERRYEKITSGDKNMIV